MALINTLATAGMKRNKKSFLGLFSLMLLTSVALCFTINLYVDLHAREAAALAEIKAGDVYAYDTTKSLSETAIAEIEALDEVAFVDANAALNIPTQFVSDGISMERNREASALYGAWEDTLPFRMFSDDAMTLVDSAPAPKANEAYVPIAFAVMPGVDIGDELVLSVGEKERTLSIAGFFEDPQMGTPFMEIKRIIIAQDTFSEVAGEIEDLASASESGMMTASEDPAAHHFTEINIHMTEEARVAGTTPIDLTQIVAEKTAWGATTAGLFSSTALVGYAMIVVIVGSAIMAVFALLLFVIALVICAHTVSSSIEEDYADYGALKAIGVSNSALTRVLILEYAGTTVLGLGFGLAASVFLVPLALPFFAQLTGILANNNAVPAAALICLSALLALVIALTSMKARKLAAISVLVAFRSGKADVHFKGRTERTMSGSWLNLQLALRAVFSAKRRYLGLITCSVLMCAFVVLIFGIGGALRGPNAAFDAFGMWKSDITVTANDSTVDFNEVDQIIEQTAGIKTTWKETFTLANLGGESRAFVGLSDTSLLKSITEGRAPELENEVLIGNMLASSMNLNIGDEFPIKGADGREHIFIICGKNSALFNAGYGSILNYDGLCNTFNIDPDSPLIGQQYKLTDPEKADEAHSALERRFGDSISLQPGGLFSDTSTVVELIQKLFTTTGYLMAAVTVALVFLAVSLIIGRMFTAERQDLGIYRALGFTSTRLRLQFALRFFLVALIGCSLGSLLVALGGSWLTSQLFGMFGVSQFMIDTNPIMLVGLTLAMALAFFLAAYSAARVIKHIEVRELVTE